MIRPLPGGLVGAVFALALAVPGAALGQPLDCDRPDTPVQATECANLRLRAAEREMAQLVSELMKSDDADFKTALAVAQDAWMQWREAEGKLAETAVSDRTLAPVARLKVQGQMTEDRVKDLRSML